MEGVLLINKPAGMTSHDCVAKMRRIARTKKVGHTGTLDPDVTGVLPVCLGRATKIVEYLTAASKTYEAEVTLGFSTTTEDSSGEVVEKKKVESVITKEDVLEALKSLTGEIDQVPPMYSAVKIGGKKLYEYARAGQTIERPSRKITIHEMTLLSDIVSNEDTVSFRFKVQCSKGTYVRTLAVMIGEKLGFPAHMSHLIRTASGPFLIDQCHTFEDIEEMAEEGRLQDELIPISTALNHLPKLSINDTLAKKVKNGAVLEVPPGFEQYAAEDSIAVYDEQGTCLAIYKQHPEKPHFLKPSKVLVI
ncbi:tRNA pseudouridine(55) synthase [Bacillus sp. HMSC76G11]|uniref:tRNA pseudouridine synthase B n=1 Tax=Metabacillus idriensis TaxID=324768 RepID=A0A6I2MD58_9BACI|nr:tRNA pseudouridine(55) synthase TruB [Metabacillus idriensis]MRX53713.1 tRNA pseudouridine(55) synthase TruB [Metabacillus idriensis]OHR64904.1 tRNA pseudouridine(55) synthase [Bacillus sp. HMSC76G11]